MKLTHLVVLAISLGILASQSFAERRGRRSGSHSAPIQNSTKGRAAEKNIGGTPADTAVQWEYTITMKSNNLSDEDFLKEVRKVKNALKAKGATFNHGKMDEPFFSVNSYLSEDEIKGLSSSVAEVKNSLPTKNFTIWFNQDTNWKEFKKELAKNKMQVTFIAGDVNKPVYISVKSAVLHVGEIYALVGKYIGGNNGQPGVEEIN